MEPLPRLLQYEVLQAETKIDDVESSLLVVNMIMIIMKVTMTVTAEKRLFIVFVVVVLFFLAVKVYPY